MSAYSANPEPNAYLAAKAEIEITLNPKPIRGVAIRVGFRV